MKLAVIHLGLQSTNTENNPDSMAPDLVRGHRCDGHRFVSFPSSSFLLSSKKFYAY